VGAGGRGCATENKCGKNKYKNIPIVNFQLVFKKFLKGKQLRQ
jgi:hypothetical protein